MRRKIFVQRPISSMTQQKIILCVFLNHYWRGMLLEDYYKDHLIASSGAAKLTQFLYLFLWYDNDIIKLSNSCIKPNMNST